MAACLSRRERASPNRRSIGTGRRPSWHRYRHCGPAVPGGWLPGARRRPGCPDGRLRPARRDPGRGLHVRRGHRGPAQPVTSGMRSWRIRARAMLARCRASASWYVVAGSSRNAAPAWREHALVTPLGSARTEGLARARSAQKAPSSASATPVRPPASWPYQHVPIAPRRFRVTARTTPRPA